MQKSTIKGLAASALFLGMFAAVQTASAGIANTRHNLGSGSLAAGASSGNRNPTNLSGMGDVFTTATTEICVFCHTPHGANTAVPVPLWNKGSLGSTTYKTFPSGTMGGNGTANAAPTDLAGHMSLACLSCHDGTQAMDNMVNQPGQGGYSSLGARLGQNVKNGSLAGVGTWYAGNNDILLGDGADNSTKNGDVSAGKLLSSAGVDFIGTDLSNDHPIGMKYAGGGCTTTGSTGGCKDTDFFAASAGLNGFFQVGGANAGDKAAMRLYSASAADTSLANATVECASCHDPHSDAQATFLRKTNANSGVCMTCHNK